MKKNTENENEAIKISKSILFYIIGFLLSTILGLCIYIFNDLKSKITSLENTSSKDIETVKKMISESDNRNQINLKNQYDMLIQLINAISSNKKISLNLYKKDAQLISNITGLNVYYPSGKPLEKFSGKDNDPMHADEKFNFSIIKTEKASLKK